VSTISVRDATDDDVPAVVGIVNQLVADTTVLWTDDPDTVDARRALIGARRARGFPTLVATDDATGEVVGHATYADFRDSISKPGYRWTVEHTIHVREDRTGDGVGPLLLGALLDRARAAGVHVMVAGIDGANEGSIRFHERHGFVVTARMPEIGHKFGRWLDLVLMQRYVDGPGAPR
jgi:phosphinothricin acetyltransferase